jgi:hypothetical protein
MKNLPSQFNSGRVPAHFANRPRSGMLEAAKAGVQASFANLKYRGSKWRVTYRGDDYPVKEATLPVVIIGIANTISKKFYSEGYVTGSENAPDCFSLDYITSDPSSPNRQSVHCKGCPQDVWGTKTSGGGRAKACQDRRRLAVVPAGDISNESLGGPMLLDIPPTSLVNLANYSSFLEKKGADFLYVITELGFENVEYPKITFNAVDWLTEEQAAQVFEMTENPFVEWMLHGAAPTEQAPAPAAAVEEPEEAPEPLSTGKPASIFGAPQQRQVIQMPARPAVPQRANGGGAGRPPEPIAATSAPAPKGRGRPAATRPLAAPANLESAIDDLLGDEE